MISTFGPILLFAAAMVAAYEFAGFYGVAIAACSMMATTAMQLAIDAFGPIADNAGGIAEMSELPEEVRERTDILDSVGNTTAAIGKGFAIASAALTALALFAAYVEFTGIDGHQHLQGQRACSLVYWWHGARRVLGLGHEQRWQGRHGNGAGSASPVQRNSRNHGRHGHALNTASAWTSPPKLP